MRTGCGASPGIAPVASTTVAGVAGAIRYSDPVCASGPSVGTPVNSGRTVYPCLPLAEATDSRLIEVPCAGVDFRLQLPVLAGPPCETWLQVQNVGDRDGKAIVIVWGEPGACPPQAAGPLKAECSGLLKPGNYTLCELAVPAGTHSTLEDQGGVLDPNTGDICLQFTLAAGEEKSFTIDLQDSDSAAVCTTDDGYGYVVMPLARER